MTGRKKKALKKYSLRGWEWSGNTRRGRRSNL